MERRMLSENLVLGPEELALLRAAFDAAWEEVAQHDGSSIEVARLRVANAILAAFRHGSTELTAIKAAALQSLKVWHPELLPSVAEARSVVEGVAQGWDASPVHDLDR